MLSGRVFFLLCPVSLIGQTVAREDFRKAARVQEGESGHDDRVQVELFRALPTTFQKSGNVVPKVVETVADRIAADASLLHKSAENLFLVQGRVNQLEGEMLSKAVDVESVKRFLIQDQVATSENARLTAEVLKLKAELKERKQMLEDLRVKETMEEKAELLKESQESSKEEVFRVDVESQVKVLGAGRRARQKSIVRIEKALQRQRIYAKACKARQEVLRAQWSDFKCKQEAERTNAERAAIADLEEQQALQRENELLTQRREKGEHNLATLRRVLERVERQTSSVTQPSESFESLAMDLRSYRSRASVLQSELEQLLVRRQNVERLEEELKMAQHREGEAAILAANNTILRAQLTATTAKLCSHTWDTAHSDVLRKIKKCKETETELKATEGHIKILMNRGR